MVAEIRAAMKDGDSLGGAVEVLAYGVPVGLGSHVHWDRKIDGLLAQALMSIQAVKAVEIGEGVEVAGRRGSEAHDPIALGRRRPRPTAAGPTWPAASRAGSRPVALLVGPGLHEAARDAGPAHARDRGRRHQGGDRVVQGAHRRHRGPGHGRGRRDDDEPGPRRRGPCASSAATPSPSCVRNRDGFLDSLRAGRPAARRRPAGARRAGRHDGDRQDQRRPAAGRAARPPGLRLRRDDRRPDGPDRGPAVRGQGASPPSGQLETDASSTRPLAADPPGVVAAGGRRRPQRRQPGPAPAGLRGRGGRGLADRADPAVLAAARPARATTGRCWPRTRRRTLARLAGRAGRALRAGGRPRPSTPAAGQFGRVVDEVAAAVEPAPRGAAAVITVAVPLGERSYDVLVGLGRPPPPDRGDPGRRAPRRGRHPGRGRRRGRPGCRAPGVDDRGGGGRQVAWRPSRSSVGRGPGGVSRAPTWWSRWAAGSSPTRPGSPPPSTTAACRGARRRRPCSPRSTRRSAARPASTCPRARTSSARSGSRRRCCATPRCSTSCRRVSTCSGCGEVAKYHFLGGTDLLDLPLDERIARCVAIKAEIVGSDERESGRRAVLNYGHTLAHALETAGHYDLRHGEAVAIGLVYAARLARRLGRIDDARVDEHRQVVGGYDLPTSLPARPRPRPAGRAHGPRQEGHLGPDVRARRPPRRRDGRRRRRAPRARRARRDGRAMIVLLLSGPNLNLLGEREPAVYGTDRLVDHLATAERAAAARGLTIEHHQSNHEGEIIDADPRRPGAVRGDHHQPRRLHPLRVGDPRRPRRVRRAGGRAAPVQSRRPRALAADVGRRAGGHRVHRRFRR